VPIFSNLSNILNEGCFGLCCVVLSFAGGADFATIRCSNPGVRG